MRRPLATVIGAGGNGTVLTPALMDQAEAVGRCAVTAGFDVVTGGYEGVMCAAARGCRIGGGRAIGILRGHDTGEGNTSLDYALPTGVGLARNVQTVLAADVVVALDGGRGTLEEILFALDHERPVLAWPYWTWLLQAPYPFCAVTLQYVDVPGDQRLVRDLEEFGGHHGRRTTTAASGDGGEVESADQADGHGVG